MYGRSCWYFRLDEYTNTAQESNATDIVEAFKVLRAGSYNHYKAFDKGLKNMGIEDGCCAVAEFNGISFCHPEYINNASN